MKFQFRPALKSDKNIILEWLEQDYIQEWLFGEGLENTIRDLENSLAGESSYFQHWLALENKTPVAYLMTSSISKHSDDMRVWSQTKGRVITLDIFIGNRDYLGKGFAHLVIQEFLHDRFPEIDEVLIDPEVSNKKAVHVYQKAGFKVLGTHIPDWNPKPHYMMSLT